MTLAKSIKKKNSVRNEYWRIPGLYSITNIVNGHKYIGSSNNLYKRLHQHLNNLRNNTHCNKHLQAAWNKYGEKNFILQGICDCDVEDLLIFEQALIDIYKPHYNIAKVAGSTRGLVFTDEHRRKISTAKKGMIGVGGQKYLGIKVKSPDDNILIIHPSLQEFCKTHGLDSSVMGKLVRRINKYKSHKGWTVC